MDTHKIDYSGVVIKAVVSTRNKNMACEFDGPMEEGTLGVLEMPEPEYEKFKEAWESAAGKSVGWMNNASYGPYRISLSIIEVLGANRLRVRIDSVDISQ